MRGRWSSPIRILSPHLWRAWWLGLILIHVPPWLGVSRGLLDGWQGGSFAVVGLGPALALNLTILFFILKLIDVRWLRLPTQRQSCLAFCLVAALVHYEALQRADLAAPEVVAIVLTATAAAGLVRLARRTDWRRLAAALARGRIIAPAATGLVAASTLSSEEFFRRHAHSPRAPPR